MLFFIVSQFNNCLETEFIRMKKLRNWIEMRVYGLENQPAASSRKSTVHVLVVISMGK